MHPVVPNVHQNAANFTFRLPNLSDILQRMPLPNYPQKSLIKNDQFLVQLPNYRQKSLIKNDQFLVQLPNYGQKSLIKNDQFLVQLPNYRQKSLIGNDQIAANFSFNYQIFQPFLNGFHCQFTAKKRWLEMTRLQPISLFIYWILEAS